jgi:hypothetical protein
LLGRNDDGAGLQKLKSLAKMARRGGQLQLDDGLAGVGGHRQGSLAAILPNSLEDFQQIGQLVSIFSSSQNLKKVNGRGRKSSSLLQSWPEYGQGWPEYQQGWPEYEG